MSIIGLDELMNRIELSKKKFQKFMQTDEFQEKLKSHPNADSIHNKLTDDSSNWIYRRILEKLEEKVDENNVLESFFLNANINYGKIFPSLSTEFTVKESTKKIHVEVIHQAEIYFNGDLTNNSKKKNSARIATLGFYFSKTNEGTELHIENIQGDIHTSSGNYTNREIMRVFGKLNACYDQNWRAGIAQDIKNYGVEQEAVVKADIPGLFYFLDSSMPQYPLYTINYLNTYLNIGIPLDNIEFGQTPDTNTKHVFVNSLWKDVTTFLETKPLDEQTKLLADASKEYGTLHKQYELEWLSNDHISTDDYEANCERAFKKIMKETFS